MPVSTYITKEQIEARLEFLAKEINRDYQESEELVVVIILSGAIMFGADLIRKLNLPVRLEFMQISSYGDEFSSSGNVKITVDLKKDIGDKDVLIVEDIVDTGSTMKSLFSLLNSRSPKSLKLASLLYKPARLVHETKIDYLGFEIEDKFVIGYGLDYVGRYRELPFIGLYNEN